MRSQKNLWILLLRIIKQVKYYFHFLFTCFNLSQIYYVKIFWGSDIEMSDIFLDLMMISSFSLQHRYWHNIFSSDFGHDITLFFMLTSFLYTNIRPKVTKKKTQIFFYSHSCTIIINNCSATLLMNDIVNNSHNENISCVNILFNN